MKPTELLLSRLEDEGFIITTFIPARGFWRRLDVHRWEALGKRISDGRSIRLYSWYTVTECVRRGIELRPSEDGANEFELQVCAKPAGTEVKRHADTCGKAHYEGNVPCRCGFDAVCDGGLHTEGVTIGNATRVQTRVQRDRARHELNGI